MTNYQIAKIALRSFSKEAKIKHKRDKPMIRQIINDSSYFISKDYDLSEYQKNLLSNYACKLHPKD